MAGRGFTGLRPASELADHLPPGQSVTFPVHSAEPTPRVSLPRRRSMTCQNVVDQAGYLFFKRQQSSGLARGCEVQPGKKEAGLHGDALFMDWLPLCVEHT